MKNIGYNKTSKNLGSTLRLNRSFFVPLIMAIRSLTCSPLAYGGVWPAQAPRRPRRLEHPHLLGGFQSKNLGGHHG